MLFSYIKIDVVNLFSSLSAAVTSSFKMVQVVYDVHVLVGFLYAFQNEQLLVLLMRSCTPQ